MVEPYVCISDTDNPLFPALSSTVQSGDVEDPGQTKELLDPGEKGPKTPELAQCIRDQKPCDSSWLDVLVVAKTIGARRSIALVRHVQSSEL